jgi:protein involved in polysaccharide export with SLBB domain
LKQFTRTDAVRLQQWRAASVAGPTTLEGLVKLGKGDDATDILVTAGGGTPTPRKNRSWDEVVNQAQHRALSEWAWRVGAGDLSPILVDVASVLGVREAADLLSRFSEVRCSVRTQKRYFNPN